MGISRSASIVIAYLIKTQKLTCQEARELCQARRPIVQPNVGFLMQLEEWDEKVNNRQYNQEDEVDQTKK